MPIVDNIKKLVHIEPFNLSRFALECSKCGHRTLTIQASEIKPVLFVIVSGVPYPVAAEIAGRLPARRDATHTDTPDRDIDAEGKTPKDGGENRKE